MNRIFSIYPVKIIKIIVATKPIIVSGELRGNSSSFFWLIINVLNQ